MDQTSECETLDSGIFSTNGTNSSSNDSSSSVYMSADGQKFDQDSLRSSLQSGFVTAMGQNSNISSPVQAKVTNNKPTKLESADSRIHCANGSGSSSSSVYMSADGQELDRDSLRSSLQSGFVTAMGQNGNISSPVQAKVTINKPIKLESAESRILSANDSSSVCMSVDGQELHRDSLRSSLQSGFVTAMGQNASISSSVQAEVTNNKPTKLENADSRIHSTNGSSSVYMSVDGQEFDQDSLRASLKSGISTPMGKNGNISSPVNAKALKTALQLTVSAQGGPPRSLTISTDDSVDKLIEESAKVCGLGTRADVYLMNGTETLQRGSNRKVKQTKLLTGNHLQLMTRCYGG